MQINQTLVLGKEGLELEFLAFEVAVYSGVAEAL